MFLHSGQTIITTPFSYECLVNVLVDRVSQTVHLYITQQCIDGGAVFERREGGREGGRGKRCIAMRCRRRQNFKSLSAFLKNELREQGNSGARFFLSILYVGHERKYPSLRNDTHCRNCCRHLVAVYCSTYVNCMASLGCSSICPIAVPPPAPCENARANGPHHWD